MGGILFPVYNLKKLSKITGRNIIAYYSGWLQKSRNRSNSSNDEDKNGFMATINGLDRNKGLDLILHTEGGDLAATESIVDYLRQIFGTNVRAIIPQIAMSAGTFSIDLAMCMAFSVGLFIC